jgi:ZIP family zinc transporter
MRPRAPGATLAAMGAAFLWGALAASSLLVGALLVLRRPIERRTLGLVMAFGAGVLLSAVAYELVAEAVDLSRGDRRWPVALGLGAGALAFFAGDVLIDRMGGERRKRSEQAAESSALALTLGILLDGIPESIVLGLTLLTGEGVGAAMLAAVFLSNLPEAMAATTGFVGSGRSRRWILGLWLALVAVSGLASFLGYVLLEDASATAVAFVLAFAAGAVLTMLADTMMPEAFEYGGKAVGLLTTLGFAVAVGIAALEGSF